MTKAKKQPKKKPVKTKKPETVADVLRRREEEAKKKEAIILEREAKKVERDKKRALNNFKKNTNSGKAEDGTKALRYDAEYQAFIEFMATPRVYRELENQGEFSKHFKVSEQTLSAWKLRPDYKYRLRAERARYISEEMLGDALVSLKKKILKEGNASEVKLLFQLADEFEEKTSVEHRKPSTLTAEQKAKFAERLASWKTENLQTNDDEE